MSARSKVLIIDDEEINATALSFILETNYDVKIEANSRLAIETAENYVPDIILCDILMPGMNGFDVLTKLKESEVTKNIPVIFISGLYDDEEVKTIRSLGAVDLIAKPFEEAIVNEKLNKHLKKNTED